MAALGLTVIVDDAELCCCSAEGGGVDAESAVGGEMEDDGVVPYRGDDHCVHFVGGWWRLLEHFMDWSLQFVCGSCHHLVMPR